VGLPVFKIPVDLFSRDFLCAHSKACPNPVFDAVNRLWALCEH